MRKKKFSMEDAMTWKMFGGIVLAVITIMWISSAFAREPVMDYAKFNGCNNPYTLTDYSGVKGYYVSTQEEATAFGTSMAFLLDRHMPWTMDKVAKVMVFKPKPGFKSSMFFLSEENCSYDRYIYSLTAEAQELIDIVVGKRWIPMTSYRDPNLKRREEHRKERSAEGELN